MNKFLERHADKITGVLSCFDRLVFHGHLPLGYPEAMERFVSAQGLLLKQFKTFVTQQSERLKGHAQDFAEQAGRPYRYLEGFVDKEDLVQAMIQKENLSEGLICVLGAVEPCRSFTLRYGEKRPGLRATRRKCLHFYFYFLDREFGLLHVRIQSWFPFQIQVCLNGHDWLARKLNRYGIAYHRQDNAFTWIENPKRAQKFADQMVKKNWPRILNAFARRVNPLLQDLLQGNDYYWVTDQAEFATDLMFTDAASLRYLYAKLLWHSIVCFSAEDVLTFLGRKLHGHFQGEVLNDYKSKIPPDVSGRSGRRLPGARVKHRMKENWIKMYDKFGCVLRIETVINHPYEFKVRRRGKRKGQEVVDWFPMTKGVAYLYRYAQVSLQANQRYLDALASVEDPTQAYQFLDRVCQSVNWKGRKARGFNPLAPADAKIFETVLRGEHALMGFRNADLRRHLDPQTASDPEAKRRSSARTSRLLQCLRAHKLIAKTPRSRRYRVTAWGQALMAAAVHLRNQTMPQLLQLRPT